MALKKSVKAAWGVSEIGFSMMSTMETVFFIVFLTDVALLPLYITGLIAAFSAIVDAVSAVIAGIVIDKVTFKKGKYRPWLLICPPIVVVFFIFMFTKIGGDITAGIICSLGYIVSHFVWNICWTANRNLIPMLSTEQSERNWASARIALGSNIGKLAGSYLVPIITSALFAIFTVGSASDNVPVPAYTVAALVMALCFLVCYYIHYAITKGCDTQTSSAKAVTFKDMGKAIVTNGQLIVVLAHDAIRLIAYYGLATFTAYYARCVIGDANSSSIILVFFYLGCILGSMLTSRVVVKLGTKKTMVFGTLACLIVMLSVLVIPANVVAISAVLFISQVFFGIAYGLTSNLYSMCGIYGEWKTGSSARGVAMAFCALAIKIGVAIRGVIIPAVLAGVGYVATASDPTIYAEGIRMGYTWMPIICFAVSLIPLIGFKLTDQGIMDMEKEIQQRKESEAQQD